MKIKYLFLFLAIITLCALGVSRFFLFSKPPISMTFAQNKGSTKEHPVKKLFPPGVNEDDWKKFLVTQKQVIENTPELKTAAFDLGHDKPSGENEFGVMIEKRKAFEGKVKAAVLKQDPTLSSVYDALGKMKVPPHQHASGGDNSPASQQH